MKFLTSILLTALLAYTIGLYSTLAWYTFAFTSLLVATTIHQKPFKAFTAGFLAVFGLWLVLAIRIDTANEQLLSHKVAQILPLRGSSFMLVLLTALVGGLVSGFAALTGSYLRTTIRKPKV